MPMPQCYNCCGNFHRYIFQLHFDSKYKFNVFKILVKFGFEFIIFATTFRVRINEDFDLALATVSCFIVSAKAVLYLLCFPRAKARGNHYRTIINSFYSFNIFSNCNSNDFPILILILWSFIQILVAGLLSKTCQRS